MKIIQICYTTKTGDQGIKNFTDYLFVDNEQGRIAAHKCCADLDFLNPQNNYFWLTTPVEEGY